MLFLLTGNKSGPLAAGPTPACFENVGGHKILSTQATKPFQSAAALITERFCGKGRCFVAAVGFAKQRKLNVVPKQMIRSREQPLLGGNGAQHKMGVFASACQKPAAGLESSMDGLNSDLRGGKVRTDQNVQMRNLAEGGLHVGTPCLHHTRDETPEQAAAPHFQRPACGLTIACVMLATYPSCARE